MVRPAAPSGCAVAVVQSHRDALRARRCCRAALRARGRCVLPLPALPGQMDSVPCLTDVARRPRIQPQLQARGTSRAPLPHGDRAAAAGGEPSDGGCGAAALLRWRPNSKGPGARRCRRAAAICLGRRCWRPCAPASVERILCAGVLGSAHSRSCAGYERVTCHCKRHHALGFAVDLTPTAPRGQGPIAVGKPLEAAHRRCTAPPTDDSLDISREGPQAPIVVGQGGGHPPDAPDAVAIAREAPDHPVARLVLPREAPARPVVDRRLLSDQGEEGPALARGAAAGAP